MAAFTSPQRILITGASGLVGSELVRSFDARGHQVVRLFRATSPPANAPTWDPVAGRIDLSSAGRLDAVVHLAGENIAQRWSPEVKRRARESRVEGTRLLCSALAKLPEPPKVLVSASATGIYGDRGAEWLDEGSASGQGFLAEVCREWEAATSAAAQAGIRVVHVRFGIVLSPMGGALAKMLPAFRLGFGGRLGDGRGYWSWIALDDVTGAIHHVLACDSLRGAVNVVTPNPVTNAEFTKTLGRVLGRPTIFPVPRFVIETVFGEMGREAMLASFRVSPSRLLETGFKFRYAELEPALRHLLGKADRINAPV